MPSSDAGQRRQRMASPQPPRPPGRDAIQPCSPSSSAAGASASSSFRLLASLPVELLEDVVSTYLGSSFALTTLTSLSCSFHSLLTSASLCRRLLLLLQASLPCPSLPAALLTDLSLWPGVSSHYALLRCLHRYSRLLGHWRSVQCYLGRLLCFSLHPQQMRILGVDVSMDVAAAAAGGRSAGAAASASQRAVVEVELLPDAAPRLYYLEYRTAASVVRHPAAVRLLLSDDRTATAGKGGDSREAASAGAAALPVSASASRGSALLPVFSSFPTRSRQAASTSSSSSPAALSASDPFTPPASLWPSDPFSSFSMYCPSLPNSAHVTLALQTLPTPVQRQQQAAFFPNPPSTYHRLPAPTCSRHDAGAPQGRSGSPPSVFPPRGLYVGQYGPHGAELMAVERVGDELLAVKVLGDANVPAGKVSFRIHMLPALSAATSETRTAAEGKRRRSREQATGRPQLSLSALQRGSTIAESLESPHSPLSSSSRSSEDEMQDAHGEDSEEDALDDAAAAGSGADDAGSSADASEMEMEAAESLAAAFLLHRRHLPRSQPALPAVAALSGSGTIALPGFSSAQAVDVRCFFHSDHSFTLDFLGLIAFTPFTCPLHHSTAAAAAAPRCHHSSSEQAETQQLQQQASSDSTRGSVGWLPRLHTSRCPRHLFPV